MKRINKKKEDQYSKIKRNGRMENERKKKSYFTLI